MCGTKEDILSKLDIESEYQKEKLQQYIQNNIRDISSSNYRVENIYNDMQALKTNPEKLLERDFYQNMTEEKVEEMLQNQLKNVLDTIDRLEKRIIVLRDKYDSFIHLKDRQVEECYKRFSERATNVLIQGDENGDIWWKKEYDFDSRKKLLKKIKNKE